MIYLASAVLGLVMGSFINALVWRLRQQQKTPSKKQGKPTYSILKGRSVCVRCKHRLAARDLVPVFSWLALRGKCRYCNKPISWQYPLVESSTAGLFVLSYIFWPVSLSGWEWLHFAIWLAVLTGLIALVVYDLCYMLLPNKIIFPLMWLAVIGVALEAVVQGELLPIREGLVGLLIGGGLFYLLFQVSRGKWIGGGDVKLGFLLGMIVGGPALALLMLFVASLLGTLVSLPLLATQKVSVQSRIPFGPFLVVGGVVAELFGQKLLNLYFESFSVALML